MERFATDISTNLYGNPHSASSCSQATRRRIDDVRIRLLRFFKASPEHFDVVFVANATAGVKLVQEAFQGLKSGYWYGYHSDCHTSLVGVRENASASTMFASDVDVEDWLAQGCRGLPGQTTDRANLFAFPAQSNMNGRRLPLNWCISNRAQSRTTNSWVYTLLDAAAYVSTTPLDLSQADAAADFTVMSLYKIFGFPDMGALIVRKEAGGIFQNRKYFGGGTVDMVVAWKESWHARRMDPLHEQLEDGTLPIHSIIALDHALDVHRQLFADLGRVSQHTASLARKLYNDMLELKHANGVPVCEIYKHESSSYDQPKTQGPIVAFNIRNKEGAWISNSEVEKLAAVENIQLRTGGLCNPAGIAMALNLEPWEMKQNFSAGQRCGNEFGSDIMNGKPTGMTRVSLGAMSTIADVNRFLVFLDEYFVDRSLDITRSLSPASVSSLCSESTETEPTTGPTNNFRVESITIYPIKSCRGWQVSGRWPLRRAGLAWDREWCLVHEGTQKALSQKQFPKMALIEPWIDFERGQLRMRCASWLEDCRKGFRKEIAVPLSDDPRQFHEDGLGQVSSQVKLRTAKLMGERVGVRVYQSPEVSEFFSAIIGSRCQLARFPPQTTQPQTVADSRSQPHVQTNHISMSLPGAWVETEPPLASPTPSGLEGFSSRLSLANDSPILIVSRSSLNRLNEDIEARGGKHVTEIEVFRANIVLTQQEEEEGHGDPHKVVQQDPYAEDEWKAIRIGGANFGLAGPCRRCQMVCLDPKTGERRQEPYATLAKRRRIGGRVIFGQHAFHALQDVGGRRIRSKEEQNPTIGIGDPVEPIIGR